jgi:two-component system NtrC family sensor kinase
MRIRSTSLMRQKISIRQQIEANGLLLIAIAMVLIYWFFDSLASEQLLTRTLIASLVIVYGVMTQHLINGRKAALLEKERTQEQLIQSESLAAIGQLVAGIAHELNNPLASASSLVQTNVEMIEEQQDKSELDQEILQDLTYSLKEINKAKEIVRSVLDLSRQTQTYQEDVDLNAVIDDTLRVLYNQYKCMDIVIEKKYDPALPTIKGNFSNLGQVFLNIIKNAFQALPECNGKITLSTSYDRDKDCVVAECRDEGSGIHADIVKDIFKPFFTTKEVGRGTGLGLYLSHQIIMKHKGDIRVRSEVGRWTSITIELPCKRSGES